MTKFAIDSTCKKRGRLSFGDALMISSSIFRLFQFGSVVIFDLIDRRGGR